MRQSSRSHPRNSPMESPRRGQTFNVVDAAGTEQLVTAARANGICRLRLSGAGAAPDADRHSVPRQVARRGSRSPLRHRLDDHPAHGIYGPDDVLNCFLGSVPSLPVVPMTNRGTSHGAGLHRRRRAARGGWPGRSGRGEPRVRDRRARDAADARRHRDRPRPCRAAATDRSRAHAARSLAASPPSLPEPPLTPDAVDFINQRDRRQRAALDVMPRRLTSSRKAWGRIRPGRLFQPAIEISRAV